MKRERIGVSISSHRLTDGQYTNAERLISDIESGQDPKTVLGGESFGIDEREEDL